MGKISGKKFNRINIVAGICLGKWVAPRQYYGSTDSNLFEFWFENCLLAEVRGKYIVMDNATFHRKARLAELAATKNCKVIFLPPYSPDLNPIEKNGLGSNTNSVKNCFLLILLILLYGLLFK